MHHPICIYSRATHYRRQAIAAMGRAAQAADQASAKALFEEVAHHWIALAEELEWLEQSNRRIAKAEGGR